MTHHMDLQAASTDAFTQSKPDHIESELMKILVGCLGVAEIGPEDDFLALGGQSITATECIVQIREVFGVDVPLVVFFSEAATLKTLSSIVRTLTSDAGARTGGGWLFADPSCSLEARCE